LVGRLVFVYAVENSHSFAVSVGKFMADTGIDGDGVAAFFVAMALVMVVVRTVGVLVTRSGLTPGGSGSTGPVRPAMARTDVATCPAPVPGLSFPDGREPRRGGGPRFR